MCILSVLYSQVFERGFQRSKWVYRWNRRRDVPLYVRQTCSCRLGGPVPGCRFTYYAGSGLEFGTVPCEAVPTLGATLTSTTDSLGGILHQLCAYLMGTSGALSATTRCSYDSCLPRGVVRGAKHVPNSAVQAGGDPKWVKPPALTRRY